MDEAAWTRLRTTSMEALLSRLTLHDSHLVTLTIDAMGRAVVDVGLDVHWNPWVPKGYDDLLLRFDRPYRIEWNGGAWIQSTIEGATSRVVDAAERAALLEDASFDLGAYQGERGRDEIPHPSNDESLTLTKLSLMNWSVLEILHSASVRCAGANGAGDLIDLVAAM